MRKLARPIKLADGRRLVTLRDAANLFSERFATVTASGVLEHAIRLLIAAAESGKRADVEAATEQIKRVLAGRRPLDRRRGLAVRRPPKSTRVLTN